MLIRPASREYRVWTTDSRRWAHYQPRPDDIIIAASAKTGQTWTQQIVSSLIFQDAVARPLLQVSPWIDRRPFGSVEDLFERIEAQKHRRFLKSHLPIDGLPLYDIIGECPPNGGMRPLALRSIRPLGLGDRGCDGCCG